ncbi:MAG: cytochrome C [Candidatus Latescibacteria bacterium]|nr:cytochrome C [Candidatus Latescibacterota bacterium]
MQRIALLLGIATALGLILMGFVVIVFLIIYPDVGPARDLNINTTPSRIARGNYLANHVTACIDCHSSRDWNLISAPAIHDTEGSGGEVFDEVRGVPGVIYAPNITSWHLGHWTDGEIARAIVSGISRDGTALYPTMPYPLFNSLADEDVQAIVSYLRTLRPLPSEVAERSLHIFDAFEVRTSPLKYLPQVLPDQSDTNLSGAYLSVIAGCKSCHDAPIQSGEALETDFAGGREFLLPTGDKILSTNITPDPSTGIGNWSETEFVERFKSFAEMDTRDLTLSTGDPNTVMPWVAYSGMTKADLKAIYTYLRSLTPVRNLVISRP